MSVASPSRAAFPGSQAGRHPRLHFRGLLRLHSNYGPLDRSTAQGGLCHRASIHPVTRTNRLPATRSNRQLSGWFLPPLVIRAFWAHHDPRCRSPASRHRRGPAARRSARRHRNRARSSRDGPHGLAPAHAASPRPGSQTAPSPAPRWPIPPSATASGRGGGAGGFRAMGRRIPQCHLAPAPDRQRHLRSRRVCAAPPRQRSPSPASPTPPSMPTPATRPTSSSASRPSSISSADDCQENGKHGATPSSTTSEAFPTRIFGIWGELGIFSSAYTLFACRDVRDLEA